MYSKLIDVFDSEIVGVLTRMSNCIPNLLIPSENFKKLKRSIVLQLIKLSN